MRDGDSKDSSKKYFTVGTSQGAIVKANSSKYRGFCFNGLTTCVGFVFVSSKYKVAVHHLGIADFKSMISELKKRWRIQHRNVFGEVDAVYFICNTKFSHNISSGELRLLAKKLSIPFDKFKPVYIQDESKTCVVFESEQVQAHPGHWIDENKERLFNFPPTLRSTLHGYSYKFLFYSAADHPVSVLIGSTSTFESCPSEAQLPDAIKKHMDLIEREDLTGFLSACRQPQNRAIFNLDLGGNAEKSALLKYFRMQLELIGFYREGKRFEKSFQLEFVRALSKLTRVRVVGAEDAKRHLASQVELPPKKAASP